MVTEKDIAGDDNDDEGSTTLAATCVSIGDKSTSWQGRREEGGYNGDVNTQGDGVDDS